MVRDIAGGECLRTLEGHTGHVYALSLMPDGNRVVSASEDNTLRVWDVATGNLVTVYPLEQSCEALTTAADNRIAIGTFTGQLHFLTLRNYL